MSKANAAAEPSMEEILASIRRIIADGDNGSAAKQAAAGSDKPTKKPDIMEEPPAPAPKPAPAPVSTAKPAEKVAATPTQDDIDAMMAAAMEDEPSPAPMEEEEEDVLDLAMARVESEAAAEMMLPPAKTAALAMDQDVDFEDAPQDEPVEEMPEPVAFAPPAAPARALPQTADVLLSREAEASVSSAFGSLAQAIFSSEPRTIEDVMKELLRPMVKSWLDDNLPAVVERLVREEISRVARGRR